MKYQMGRNKYNDRVDGNQNQIVKDLEKMGYTVDINHNDLIVGGRDLNFWFELKNKRALDKNGKVRETEIKKSQKKIRATWRGQYDIVSSLDQILLIMRKTFNKFGV